jgi:hypothetical protein
MLEAERAAALAAEAAAAKRHDDVLNHWRDLPTVPEWHEYVAWAQCRRFVPPAPPARPDEVTERSELAEMIRGEVTKRGFWERAGVAVAVVVGTVVALVAMVAEQALPLVGLVVVVIILINRRRKAIVRAVECRMGTEWQEHWNRAVQRYAGDVLEYERHVEDERRSWEKSETARVAGLSLLLRGDQEAMSEALEAALSELEFPFETGCRTEVVDAERAVVLLDLPEIEDVVPETRLQALKSGTLKEAKRTKADRNRDYAHLVTGLGLMMGRAAFRAVPTLQSVTIAAYTQRRHGRSGAIADDFVYEISLSRDQAARLPSTVDPIAFMRGAAQRLDLRDSGELRRINAPAWALELAS